MNVYLPSYLNPHDPRARLPKKSANYSVISKKNDVSPLSIVSSSVLTNVLTTDKKSKLNWPCNTNQPLIMDDRGPLRISTAKKREGSGSASKGSTNNTSHLANS